MLHQGNFLCRDITVNVIVDGGVPFWTSDGRIKEEVQCDVGDALSMHFTSFFYNTQRKVCVSSLLNSETCNDDLMLAL